MVVSFVIARELVIEDAKKPIVWALGAEEIKVVCAVCSSAKPSFFDGFGSMGVFHVSAGFVYSGDAGDSAPFSCFSSGTARKISSIISGDATAMKAARSPSSFL